MTQFPALSGKNIVDVLKRLGFEAKRQKGSHIFLQHPDGRATVVPCIQVKKLAPVFFPKYCVIPT
jgi:predicted RNA binding protein YcfA (HicA-like mRNA interferase family)